MGRCRVARREHWSGSCKCAPTLEPIHVIAPPRSAGGYLEDSRSIPGLRGRQRPRSDADALDQAWLSPGAARLDPGRETHGPRHRDRRVRLRIGPVSFVGVFGRSGSPSGVPMGGQRNRRSPLRNRLDVPRNLESRWPSSDRRLATRSSDAEQAAPRLRCGDDPGAVTAAPPRTRTERRPASANVLPTSRGEMRSFGRLRVPMAAEPDGRPLPLSGHGRAGTPTVPTGLRHGFGRLGGARSLRSNILTSRGPMRDRLS